MGSDPPVDQLKALSILGCQCLPVESELEAKVFLRDRVESSLGGYSVAINAEKIMRCREDPKLKKVVDGSVMPIPDGAGAVLGLRMLYGQTVIKLDLPKLALQLSNECGWRVFIGGAAEEVNALAVKKILDIYPNIKVVGAVHGFVAEDELVRLVIASRPQLVLLALGSPKQEFMAADFVEKIGGAFVIGCGGALDILAGRVSRAPSFMVNNHLEWLYRLAKQPSRWRRQLQLPKYVCFLMHAVFRKKLSFAGGTNDA